MKSNHVLNMPYIKNEGEDENLYDKMPFLKNYYLIPHFDHI